MNEGDTLSYQLFVFCIYVIDRDREGNARTGQDFALKQKDRQIKVTPRWEGAGFEPEIRPSVPRIIPAGQRRHRPDPAPRRKAAEGPSCKD